MILTEKMKEILYVQQSLPQLKNINFMATYGKGLICMPMSKEYVEKLRIPQMVTNNTDNHETAFTVSIDAVDTTTGISAAERSIYSYEVC